MTQELTELKATTRLLSHEELSQQNELLSKRVAILEQKLNQVGQAIIDVTKLVQQVEKLAVKNVFGAISSIFHGVAHQFDAESLDLLTKAGVPTTEEGAPASPDPKYTLREIDPAENPTHIVLTKDESGYHVFRSDDREVEIIGEHADTIINNLGELDMHQGEEKYLLFVQV